MRILLTGHKGYIGAVGGSLLRSAGHIVIGLDADLYDGCDFGGSLQELPEIRKDIRDLTRTDLDGFDAVVHLATLSNDLLGNLNRDLTFAINHQASVHMAELAKQAGVKRFVFSSSCSVYGTMGAGFLDENSSLNPLTTYALSKVMVERDVAKLASSHFSPTFLRNATAYGVSPRLRLDVALNDFVASAFTTGSICIKSDGTPWRPVAHIRDIMAAVLNVLDAPQHLIHNETFNVGHTMENYRVSELADIVAQVVPGSRVEYAPGGGPDQRCYRVCCDKIQRVLGFRPQWTARTGAQELHDSFRRAGLTDEQRGRYLRIATIEQLLKDGKLDASLRWSTAQVTAGAGEFAGGN